MMLVLGSFGHFQASKSGVHKGGLHQPLVKAGFVATRISVRLYCLSFCFYHVDYFFTDLCEKVDLCIFCFCLLCFRLQLSILKLLEP